jgi:hypothetical protein
MLPDLGARTIWHAPAQQSGDRVEIYGWRVADQIIGTLDYVAKLLPSLRRCVVS